MLEGPTTRRDDGPRPRINRAPSPILAQVVPWLSVVLATIVPTWFVIASAPMFPPFGFLTFLAWRQLRPGLLPLWAGLPLGLVDDLFSGQPFGSAVLLWSLAAMAIDNMEERFPWRNFATEWLVATSLIILYILGSYLLSNLVAANAPIHVVVPQLVISIFAYPLIGRLVAVLDRLRLTAVRISR
ncbi:rod shape-determining protein MreD [Novosphingobium mangrovi (ex Hu et al. 2023)]|uniref:Rod shape-determining protein MreD n=1 Tax=Novosphingobium mangrovi (ex Hu et al. 2023) TaxID=2930094 RepID=A0ABT0A9E4_9SPHN|nr:rod shape-determining protein MreD [Novosphingobium mangrovi (ex Hu et al. 2023)]MCJ1959810.1 rod shape-determining protein MreD [Novosphingobium mangrovi (ex Hu et al. 2023)]